MDESSSALGTAVQQSVWEGIQEVSQLKAALDEHALVTVTDPYGRIVFVNDKFCALSKYPREELLGQDHRVVNSGFHPASFFRELWSTIGRAEVWHGEIKNRAKDGSYYWVATTIVPLLDPEGRPRQFVAIRADITAQKRVEAELAEKEQWQRLLSNLSAHFMALPPDQIDGAIEDTQRTVVETLGLDRSTLWQLAEGQGSMLLTHCWQRPGWPPLPSQFDTGENLPWAYQNVISGKGFSFSSLAELPPEAARDVETFRQYGPKSNVTIPLLANGQVFGALAFAALAEERSWREAEIVELKLVGEIISNVLARHRAELREEQLREELAHAMRVATLGELAAALSHELNQPLAAILSNAQAARRFLADGSLSLEDLRAILDDIVRDDKRAGSVIQNLRAMASKRPVLREACCLNTLVREVLELMHGELTGEGVRVRLSLSPQLPPVHAAKVEIQQVLVNLLVNAVHAMNDLAPENRGIEISTGCDGDTVTVSVLDQGPGVPPERLGSIFAPFFTTKSNGLGMGLSICRRIIENHAGHIHAENHGSGAQFSFSLPVSA